MSEFDKDELIEDETLEEEVDSEVAEDEEENLDNQLLEDNHDVVVDIKLSEEMEKSFLSYAMSVIVARALPDVRDEIGRAHV